MLACPQSVPDDCYYSISADFCSTSRIDNAVITHFENKENSRCEKQAATQLDIFIIGGETITRIREQNYILTFVFANYFFSALFFKQKNREKSCLILPGFTSLFRIFGAG